ncbi:MAG: hypothetical protein Q9162_002075 [Coniocarpon cinnabarinum]
MNRSPSSDASSLKRAESYQYPEGHVTHLDEPQEQKLEQFKQLCAEKGYYRPATQQRPEPSHDDETLLRYLRARKFVPTEAFKQFKDTEDWRRDNEIDKLYDSIDVDEYNETRLLYPQWIGRRDKRGIPLYVFEVAGLDSKRMSEYQNSLKSKNDQNPAKGNISPNLRRLFALYENLIQCVMPLCSAIPSRPYPDTPVSQSGNIVDISRTGLKQFWNLKGHMQEASQLATAHYPETLDRIFIIGAPSFFPTVWSWIKRWFDPITVSKIFILSQNETYKVLSEYIDPANIPKKYGGELDWEWGQLPNLEPDIAETMDWKMPVTGANGANAFPPGPIRWRVSKDGQTMSAVSLGTVDGKQREDVVATMPLPPAQKVGDGAARPGLNKLANSTGVYTHPSDDVKEFPSSGQTPIDTPSGSDAQSMSSKLSNSIHNGKSVSEADFAARNQQQQQTAATRQMEDRQGTSGARLDAQAGTHAEGVHSDATPATIDHGHGDKSNVVETGTIAQGNKDVTVPERPKEQPGGQESYVDQAKHAVAGAATTVTSTASGIAEKVGLSHNAHDAKANQEEKMKEDTSKKQDPEVEKMGDVAVEDFIRSKYATHANSDPAKKVDKEVDQ